MGAVAVFPPMEHDFSIVDVLENAWSSNWVLSPSRVFHTVQGDGDARAVEDERLEDSRTENLDEERFIPGWTEDVESVDPSDDPAGVSGSGLRWCLSVDEAELRAIFRTFDENEDGLISKEDLRRFTKVFGIEMSDADAESMIASVAGNRKDSSGINFKKFCCLYRTHVEGQNCSREVEVARAKEDNDSLVQAFKVFDKNGDGMISAEELKTVLSGLGLPGGKSLRQCTKMIQKVDSDGNGQCDLSEFKRMMASRSL